MVAHEQLVRQKLSKLISIRWDPSFHFHLTNEAAALLGHTNTLVNLLDEDNRDIVDVVVLLMLNMNFPAQVLENLFFASMWGTDQRSAQLLRVFCNHSSIESVPYLVWKNGMRRDKECCVNAIEMFYKVECDQAEKRDTILALVHGSDVTLATSALYAAKQQSSSLLKECFECVINSPNDVIIAHAFMALTHSDIDDNYIIQHINRVFSPDLHVKVQMAMVHVIKDRLLLSCVDVILKMLESEDNVAFEAAEALVAMDKPTAHSLLAGVTQNISQKVIFRVKQLCEF